MLMRYRDPTWGGDPMSIDPDASPETPTGNKDEAFHRRLEAELQFLRAQLAELDVRRRKQLADAEQQRAARAAASQTGRPDAAAE